MLARTPALVAVVLAGCAGPQKSQVDSLKMSETGLYLGHSTNGDVVLAATHYDAMSGLATTEQELGLSANSNGRDGQMLCQRETPTGTHVPRWICRYKEDIRRERELTRDWLDQPRLSFSGRAPPSLMMGRGGGGGGPGRGTYVP